MAPSPPWSLHTRRHRWYDHGSISCMVPSDVGTMRHATAAHFLRQGVCEPPGDLSSTLYLLISARHYGFPLEHGSLLLPRRGC
jgi:hypothetical protein